MIYNIGAARDFFNQYICNREFNELCMQRGFSVNGLISPKCWEIFASLLVNEKRNPGDSPDLTGEWEVKSAVMGSSFEYQYCREAGLVKLKDDMTCKHLFISYESNYQATIVRTIKGEELSYYFNLWKPLLVEAYKNPKVQRFRKSIPYTLVANKATFVMKC